MRKRFRILLVLASTFAMVLMLNVGTAFAHEPANTVQLGVPNSPFGSDPPLTALLGNSQDRGGANVNGIDGLFQGFVVHAPTCSIHQDVDAAP